MGTYTSKYTGAEIDNLLGQVENGGGAGGSSKKVTLWEGTLTEINTAVTLNDSVENYDVILVEAMASAGDTKAAIETRLVDVGTIDYTGSVTSSPIACYNLYTTTGSGGVYYRVLFAFANANTFYIVNKSVGTSSWTNPRITKITGIKLLNGGSSTSGSNPTGTIISFMGLVAPNGYLICDGSELNIAEYGDLASHFETQFGTKNHFGGDGETTFALPDLRNEFLRGYHGDAEEQLSGEVGIHQEGTWHVNICASPNDGSIYSYKNGASINVDSHQTPATKGYTSLNDTNWASTGYVYYTSRPTNIAVLYCIKY